MPYKLRFALNNPQIHIAGLHRALKGVSHYLALKTLLQFMDGRDYLAGTGVNGYSVCANVGRTGLFAQLRS
ncbi:putative permease [Salmonella enterica subsp. enterica serovar Typhimurium]|nr:putative permease [Salmonella enterica subsp. enterica serovar Typhimurium]